MAVVAPNLSALETQLGSLGLESPLPELPATDVLTKPLDIYRSHLASLVATAADCDVAVAYKAITLSTDISLGDMAVILPRLKAKADDLADFAMEITQKVSRSPIRPLIPSFEGSGTHHLPFL